MFSMNLLSTERRAQILGMLVEGNSLRATARMAGCSFNTVSKLLLDVGEACAEYQSRVLIDLPCTTIERDEIWSFCYSKAKNVLTSTRTRSATATYGRGSRSARIQSSFRRGSLASARQRTV